MAAGAMSAGVAGTTPERMGSVVRGASATIDAGDVSTNRMRSAGSSTGVRGGSTKRAVKYFGATIACRMATATAM
jgi:hypothetical protein